MKTVQLIEIDKDLEDREIPTPEPKPYEVLIRIKAASACMKESNNWPNIPNGNKIWAT